MSREKDDEAVWIREDWELTWPIWHMLPHDERKSLARKYGYATIGEFEEDMTLRRAVGDSSEQQQQQQPYDNSLLYTHVEETKQETELESRRDAKKNSVVQDEEELEADELDEVLEKCSASGDDLSETELMERAGTIILLPEELIHRLLEWLPVDMYATLALVSPHWKYLTRTESVYKRLCERCYLNQSKRRSLNMSRFGYSYRTMLEKRPRVRAGGGLYALKYTSVKKIQRDMWTEIPVGAVLETVYYRYLLFQENGRCLYALTNDPPHEMIRRFCKMMITKQPDKAAVWGRYQVAKNTVTVVAQQQWQVVRLDLSIQATAYGRALVFDRHLTSSNGAFDDYRHVVEHKVPDEVFRFLKDRRL